MHTHTARCEHAQGLDIKYVHSVINAGFEILGQHLKYLVYEYDCCCSDEDVITYVVRHPEGRRVFWNVRKEVAHCITRTSIAYDTPLEINLNGKKSY